jgi:hypothetical protein
VGFLALGAARGKTLPPVSPAAFGLLGAVAAVVPLSGVALAGTVGAGDD